MVLIHCRRNRIVDHTIHCCYFTSLLRLHEVTKRRRTRNTQLE